MIKDLSKRSNQAELMDDFDVPKAKIKRVFKDINRANQMLGGNQITINAVVDLIRMHPKEEYVIADMGCGDGSMLRQIVRYFRKRQIGMRCIGIDLNDNAIALGKEACAEYPEIQFLKQDVLALAPAELQCDIMLCTLTVHHFTNEEIPIFLNQFISLSKLGVVINDLERSVLAYYLFKLFSTIFIKTKIAKSDGLISISRGFKKSDLIRFSKALPQATHRIKWKWAFRYVWIMQTKRLTVPYE